jgi:hypothetical protein
MRPIDLPRCHRWWFRLCFAAISFFLALHALYSTSLPFPVWVTVAWGAAMFFELSLFFFPTVFSTFAAPVAGAFLLIVVLSRRLRRWAVQVHEVAPNTLCWTMRPWLHSLLWLAFLVNHALFDVDPHLLLVWASALALAFPEWGVLPRRLCPRSVQARAAAWISLTAGWSLLAQDRVQVLATTVLSIGLFVLFVLRSRLLVRDRFAASVVLLLLAQVFAALVPIGFSRLHGGTQMAPDAAYSFCESKAHHKLFAALRRCGTIGPRERRPADWLESCDGVIAEYDSRSLTKRAEHRFFSERFLGRFEHLVCLEDTVQVGMDESMVDGRYQSMSLLEFRIDDPSDYRTNVLGSSSGNLIAWDRRQRAVYYLSDEHPLVRRDLATGELDSEMAASAVFPSFGLTDIGVHEGRNSLFLMDRFGWIQEIDLSLVGVDRSYTYGHGWEFAIDEERERLYLSGSWGLEVLDLETGRILRRVWLGLGGRRPAIDYQNDFVYVPSEGAGKLHVLDRHSLRLLGNLPLGGGIRYPYVSVDGRWLFASNGRAHFYWSTADLAKRFRPI